MPSFIASKDTLNNLRKRAAVAKMVRDLECGNWSKFLIDLKKAKHRYKEIQAHSGKIEALVVKLNFIRMAIRFHTMVAAGSPVTMTAQDGLDAQREALKNIRTRSAFDGMFMQVVRRANIEAWSSMRVDVGPHGTYVCADRNDNILPVGHDGPDMQPTVWERRWIIEREVPRGGVKEKVKYLRVERHSAPNGVGMIEQEVYTTKTDDIYQYLGAMTPLDINSVLPDQGLVPMRKTGASHPLIVRFVHEYYDGQPEALMSEFDLDILDMVASAMSRVDRSLELHGSPKVRVSESMIDQDTGEVKATEDAIVDPEKEFEYIKPDFNFADMLAYMGKTLQLAFAQLQLSPALVGIKLEGGAMPDTFDKLKLEASNTLARGKASSMYMEPSLGRVMTIASELDASRPMQGYPVGSVTVMMHTGLPRDRVEKAREYQVLRAGGNDALVDRLTAFKDIHGEEAGEAMYEQVKLEEQEALMNAVPAMPGDGFGGAA